MTTTDHNIHLLQYLIDAPDIDDHIKDDAQRTLALFYKASELHRSQHQHLRQVSGQYAEHLQTASRTLVDDLQHQKKHRLHELCDERRNLTTTKDHATIADQISREAMRKAELAVSTRIFNTYSAELFTWVARRRADQPFTCGLTDTITAELVAIYDRIRPQLFPRHHPELNLSDSLTRLPAVIESSWPQDTRSSIAWMWQQIAHGHFDYVPHPHDPNGQSRTLRITSFPTRIPQAPRLPKASQP